MRNWFMRTFRKSRVKELKSQMGNLNLQLKQVDGEIRRCKKNILESENRQIKQIQEQYLSDQERIGRMIKNFLNEINQELGL